MGPGIQTPALTGCVFARALEGIAGKIKASKDKKGNLTNEMNLMQAEVTAMKIVAENCSFKVADVQYYDSSNIVCDGNYFFMEKLEGENFHCVKNKLTKDEIARINTEIEPMEGTIKLYNNQVFIADNIKEVIPEFLLLFEICKQCLYVETSFNGVYCT